MPTSENPGCLGFLLAMFGLAPRKVQDSVSNETDTFPYRLRDDFLSPAEASFYGVLRSTLGSRMTVCPKVGLSDVFFVARPNENRSAFNRIAQKHVDFLLCDPATMKPLLGIELDDSSHTRADRQTRDEFVEKVFQAADLPLLRIPVQRAYNPQELSTQIDSRLIKATISTAIPMTAPAAKASAKETSNTDKDSADTTPLCPKCDLPMVIRSISKGDRQGEQFYGCPNYPRCRNTVPIPKVIKTRDIQAWE